MIFLIDTESDINLIAKTEFKKMKECLYGKSSAFETNSTEEFNNENR